MGYWSKSCILNSYIVSKLKLVGFRVFSQIELYYIVVKSVGNFWLMK